MLNIKEKMINSYAEITKPKWGKHHLFVRMENWK